VVSGLFIVGDYHVYPYTADSSHYVTLRVFDYVAVPAAIVAPRHDALDYGIVMNFGARAKHEQKSES
jgi:hypothetical protein